MFKELGNRVLYSLVSALPRLRFLYTFFTLIFGYLPQEIRRSLESLSRGASRRQDLYSKASYKLMRGKSFAITVYILCKARSSYPAGNRLWYISVSIRHDIVRAKPYVTVTHDYILQRQPLYSTSLSTLESYKYL